MRLIIITLSLVLSWISLIAQNNSAKALRKIIKSNLNGTTFQWNKKFWSNGMNSAHSIEYKSWRMCNDDSLYYKSKTIRLYNSSYYNKPNCELYKEWILKSKSELVLADIHWQMGTTTPAVKYRIKRVKNNTLFIIYSEQKIEKFSVEKLEKGYNDVNKVDSFYVLTLNRID